MPSNSEDKRRVRQEILRSVSVISMETEEILGMLAEQPLLGDNGVAEAVIRIENAVTLIGGRLRPNAKKH